MNQEIFIYIDDSGVLHEHSRERYFIYAGYIFVSKAQKDYALAKYRAANKKVHTGNKELKACNAKGKTKRYLLSNMKQFESFACVVDIRRVYSKILAHKKSIHRYKDYCLKRLIKAKIEELIRRKRIKSNIPTILRIFIDNQPTSTDGIYNLRESIREEFSTGIENYDYGTYFPPIFKKRLCVEITFCDSKMHFLIQASDMLANCTFIKYNYNPKIDHGHKHHLQIFLP